MTDVLSGPVGDNRLEHIRCRKPAERTEPTLITPPGVETRAEAKQWSDFLAPAWERYRDRLFASHRVVSDWLIDQIDPQPGQTVLELAAGPGETGFLVAERLGPQGSLISSDFAPGMVDAARRGAATRGLENVEYRVMDAEHIDMADECVDGILCRFGLMLMTRPIDAVRGARRILCPGGRFAYAVWGPPQENRWMTILGIAMAATGHDSPGGGPFECGGPFSLASPERNRHLLEEGGFRDVCVEKLVEVLYFDDFDDYWAVQSRVSGAMGHYLSSLSADEVVPIQTALRPLMAPFQLGTGYAFPSVVLGASAR